MSQLKGLQSKGIRAPDWLK
uniref:Uncharacterized protein n=1 Tax=Arundo donax TaxID=35708 RepID=A0A0A8ZL29_ARUDO